MASFEKRELKKKSENISDWYTDAVLKAEIADYGPARGTMVIRPYGYGIWELVQQILGGMIKEGGVENAYFPLFIPHSLLAKEKDHVEGFSPELAIVTKAGGEDLADPLVVRPTSETIMYEMYSKWVHSWRDLPIKINQWNSVVRWEKRTLLFIRTSEFLWQEGHCAHATEVENREMVMEALHWYIKMYEEYFAIPVVSGIKSESEKFAGADATFTVEALMPDGKALQGCTSHDLGQNFSKAQNISFQDKEGNNQFAWQNSWGFSTRTLGALFMVHGDDNGLIMPPKIAPIQVVAVPINAEDNSVLVYTEEVSNELKEAGVRVHTDKREGWSPGRKFNDWEVKGVPIRFEIGKDEVEKKTITFARRDTGEKYEIDRAHLVSEVEKALEDIQNSLFEKAKKHLEENTHDVENYDEFKEIMNGSRGFIKAFWCEDPECEARIKEETKATTRCRPVEVGKEDGKCILCGKEAKFRWYFAQAY
jgi:prolyl-tRNA synthetase